MRGRWLILAGAALALHSTAHAGDGSKEVCIRAGVDDGVVNDIAIAVPPADHPDPDANYEGLQQLELHGFPEQRIALLRWDLSNLKLTTPPQAVKLRLTFTKTTSASLYGVHALLRPWTSTEATWLRPAAGEAWRYPGAEPGTDFDPADLAAFVPDQPGMDIYLDGGVELVEQWAADGGENFGILIRNVVALDDAKFWSAEAELALYRPALVLSFGDSELVVRDIFGVYSGEVDTTIASGVPPTQAGQVLVVRGATLGSSTAVVDPAVSLLRFDVSRIPPLAQVVGATLELWDPAERSGRIIVDGMARDWSDQEATWNQATNATAWTTPGALAVGADGGDRLGWVAADFQPSGSENTVELTDAGIELVQGWVSGEIPNHGFFMGASSPETVAMFVNSEATDEYERPMLCVRYVDRTLALQIPCGCSAGGGLTVTALAFSLVLRALRRRRV